MKKVLALILAVLMAASLCACGGMDGKKAAEMYPDIIGQWGTDPFGEEFVLTLSKDGSCEILGAPGTWKLDKKNTNGEQAVLAVKTDALKYYLEFDRVQKDRHYMYNSVNLLIMDAKKETTIYENFVFTQGDWFVTPELALHTVPELVGEWGSVYWAKEPAITIREDGTCTVLRQPGKWRLWRDFSTWPKIVILVKLENGLQYEIEFYVWEDSQYRRASFLIYNRVENVPVEIDPNIYSPMENVIKRAAVTPALEIASWALGTWTDRESGADIATFNEDGTCILRGAEGLWTVNYDYAGYLDHSGESPDDLDIRVKIADREYQLGLWQEGPDNYRMNIFDNGMEILPYAAVIKAEN